MSLTEFTTRLSVFIEEKVKKSKSTLFIARLSAPKKNKNEMKNPVLLPPFSVGRGNGFLSSDAWAIDGSNLKVVPRVTFKQAGWFLARITTLPTYEEHAYLSTEAR